MLKQQKLSSESEKPVSISRRGFLMMSGASVASALALDSLRSLVSRAEVNGASLSAKYGALQPDPQGLLDLPPGFQYRVISQTGEKMNDGYRVPAAPDGMATFQSPDGNIVLVRNHELSPGQRPAVSGGSAYDASCSGGTTTLILDRDRNLVRQHSSLVGTYRNCAGGTTPWNSWITCEETVATPADEPVKQRHGYNFEVPAFARRPVEPIPLKAMGRFNHEAIAVDPQTGIVYQTEDRPDSLFYRFIPNVPEQLAQGGKLEALKIKDYPQAITRTGFRIGQAFEVEWVTLDDPDPEQDTVRIEGFAKGAAQFSRGEGIVFADDSLYFTCTNGGNNQRGQIWRYRPNREDSSTGTLSLFVEPNDETALDYPDNITLSPFGDLFICEDGFGNQYLRSVDQSGNLSTFARNALNEAEFAGVCFATNPLTLFVNIQSPGITVAIWGDFPISQT
jgi:uncharacterized protein